MTIDRARAIRETWESIEDSEPDISTEQLLARVSELENCDDSDVAEAIEMTNDES